MDDGYRGKYFILLTGSKKVKMRAILNKDNKIICVIYTKKLIKGEVRKMD